MCQDGAEREAGLSLTNIVLCESVCFGAVLTDDVLVLHVGGGSLLLISVPYAAQIRHERQALTVTVAPPRVPILAGSSAVFKPWMFTFAAESEVHDPKAPLCLSDLDADPRLWVRWQQHAKSPRPQLCGRSPQMCGGRINMVRGNT